MEGQKEKPDESRTVTVFSSCERVPHEKLTEAKRKLEELEACIIEAESELRALGRREEALKSSRRNAQRVREKRARQRLKDAEEREEGETSGDDEEPPKQQLKMSSVVVPKNRIDDTQRDVSRNRRIAMVIVGTLRSAAAAEVGKEAEETDDAAKQFREELGSIREQKDRAHKRVSEVSKSRAELHAAMSGAMWERTRVLASRFRQTTTKPSLFFVPVDLSEKLEKEGTPKFDSLTLDLALRNASASVAKK